MSIVVRIHDSSGRITMPEAFDFKMHRDFKSAYTPLLDNAALREIEIELGKVEFIDSSALGMLMLLNERAKAANKMISLLNPNDTVSRMLDVANFSKVFNIRR